MQSDQSYGRWPSVGLCIATAVVMALAFPKVGLWFLAWLAFPSFLLILRGRTPLRGLFWGWLTGAIATTIAMSWVAGLLIRFAQLPWPLAALVAVISGIFHGATFGVTGLLTCWLWTRGVRPIVALPASLVVAELLVPMVFTWQIGMSQHDVLPIIQIADLLGTKGISMVVALGGAAAYELLAAPKCQRTRIWVLGAAGLVLASVLYGTVRVDQVEAVRARAPAMNVGLVQAGLTIYEKHDERRFPINLALHQDMTAQLEREGAELVVWPESAYPYYIDRRSLRDRRGPNAVRRGFTVPVIFGTGSIDRERRRFNSAYLLDESGRLLGPADKNVLLVFGEYIPFYDRLPWLQEWFPDAWNFTPGTEPGVLETGELRAGVLNCYEDILPGFVREMAQRRPNLLVNITNDAWFGDTAEPYQHAALARLRAVEHRIDLVRAVNSGMSTVVAATGEMIASAPVSPPQRPREPDMQYGPLGGSRSERAEFFRTTVLARIRLVEAGSLYSRFGDTWAWILTALMFGFLARASWRERKKKDMSPTDEEQQS